jgi:hypothetical protein
MKKLMMIAAMMVATLSANAQFDPGTFSIQPKIGGQVTWLSNMPKLPIATGIDLDKTPMGGALIGVEAEYQLTDMFSVAGGLNYSLQGSAWEDVTVKSAVGSIDVKDSKIELGYITVPVTANVYLAKGLAVKAGVQFGFMTSAKMKSTVEQGGTKTETDVDFKDNCSKFDFSIPVGVSYQFKVPIVLDLRYNIGLTKVNKESADKNSKNNVVSFTVGYKFAL